MVGFTVREATVEHAEGIVAVFNPIIESGLYTTITQPFSVQEERDFIQQLPERGILHVAVADDSLKVAGFQGLTPFPTITQA